MQIGIGVPISILEIFLSFLFLVFFYKKTKQNWFPYVK